MLQKHADIVTDVVIALNKMSQCGVEISDLDKLSFVACKDVYVIFQARLSGTSDCNSEYLISILTKWVSTSQGIIVNGLEMEVANNELNFSTLVSDFDEKNYLTVESHTVAAREIIVASLASILIVAMVTCTVIVVVVVMLKKKRSNRVEGE